MAVSDWDLREALLSTMTHLGIFSMNRSDLVKMSF